MTIRLISIFTLTFALIFGLFSTVQAESEEDILAIIGDKKITSADLDEQIERIPTYARSKFLTAEGKAKLLDRLVKTELLMQAAIDEGYEDRPDIKEQFDEARKKILTSEYFKAEIGQPKSPSESKLLQYYEDHKENYRTEASAKASHIVFETEQTALDTHEKILKQEITFEDAVERFSIDERTKNTQGNLGTISRDGFIRGIGRSSEFMDAVFSLKPTEISKPIKSRKGWHLIRLDEMNDEGYQPFENVKAQIEEQLLVTDQEIQAEYDSNPDEYYSRARRKIKHILVASEEEAENIHQELEKGADFEELVKTKSTDVASVKQNGSLGYLYKDGYVRGIGKDPNFETEIFSLKLNVYSSPIKTKKGWHIVLVDEITENSLKPLSEVEDQIRKALIRDKKQSTVEDKFKQLEEKYNCTVFEDRLKDSNPQQ